MSPSAADLQLSDVVFFLNASQDERDEKIKENNPKSENLETISRNTLILILKCEMNTVCSKWTKLRYVPLVTRNKKP